MGNFNSSILACYSLKNYVSWKILIMVTKRKTVPIHTEPAAETKKVHDFYHLPKNSKREVVYVYQGGGALGA